MIVRLILLSAIITIVSGCVSGGGYVSRGHTYQKLNYGAVIAREDIVIGGTHSGIGAYIGSAAAIHDSTSHSFLGYVVRGIVGSIVGSIAEEAITRQKGVLYTIELNHGAIVEVASTDESFGNGECVQVAHAGHHSASIDPAPARKCAPAIVKTSNSFKNSATL